jgi:DNA polymerase-3 subunit delta
MAIVKRLDLVNGLKKKSVPEGRLFLFFGERYLSRTAADQLQDTLLGEQPGTVHDIDGEAEEPGQTLSRLMSFSLLPGRQIYRVNDSRIFHSREVLSDIWQKAAKAHQAERDPAALRHLQSIVLAAGVEVTGETPLSEIPRTEWKKLFGFDKPEEEVGWADSLLQRSAPTRHAAGQSVTDKYIEAFEKGLPGSNILILTAETVDKRQRLFTHFKNHGTVVDCSVTSGSNMAAQKEQKAVLNEMIVNTLATFQKRIDPQAVDIFFERVGFHPVAVVTEIEKLAHYVGDRELIDRNDLEAMVVRNREDALYELTDAFSKRQTCRTITILSRLLDQGVHGLAILATMRSFLRKHLIFRSLQMGDSPRWHHGMNVKEFQNSYLPELKASGQWSELLKGHPYALFMSFSRASTYSCSGLKRWLEMVLKAEFRLKSSALPQQLVLEELFFGMLMPRRTR